MADIDVYKLRLSEAERAYHHIQISGSTQLVKDQNGEAAQYSRVNLADLGAYIRWLKEQIGMLEGGTGYEGYAPMRVFM